jgi:formylglycine-generating enzyme required for sulfatase activity
MGMRSNIQASQEECHEQGKYEGSKQTMKSGKSNQLKRMAIAAVCVGMIGSGGLVQAMTTAKPVSIKANKNGGAVKGGATTLVRVPASRITSVPTGEKDTIRSVKLPDFEISKTEVTNDLFSTVAFWAHSNGKGYQIVGGVYENFQYKAGEDKLPIVRVAWCEAIVWLNAYSEMHGLQPVYWKKGGLFGKPAIFKDALDTKTCDDVEVRSQNSGYQLPSDTQFNIAARWLGTTAPTKGTLAKNRLTTKGKDGKTYYWTPGNYASGAIEDVNNKKETARVAGERAVLRPVGSKAPNNLGLFDMNGNVGEWLSTPGDEGQRMRISSGIQDQRIYQKNPKYQQYSFERKNRPTYAPKFYTGNIDPFSLSHRIIQDPGEGSGQCRQSCVSEHRSYFDVGFRIAKNAK